jgi:hypothetical protein
LSFAKLPLLGKSEHWYIGTTCAPGIHDQAKRELHMCSITINDNELKALLKQALTELFEEKSELLHEAIAEVIEEIGLAEAIKEGQASPTVDKARVFEVLEQES